MNPIENANVPVVNTASTYNFNALSSFSSDFKENLKLSAELAKSVYLTREDPSNLEVTAQELGLKLYFTNKDEARSSVRPADDRVRNIRENLNQAELLRDRHFRDWTIDNLSSAENAAMAARSDLQIGYYGVCFVDHENKKVIAVNEGTHPDFNQAFLRGDLGADAHLALSLRHVYHDEAIAFGQQCAALAAQLEYDVIYAGHSLGGHLSHLQKLMDPNKNSCAIGFDIPRLSESLCKKFKGDQFVLSQIADNPNFISVQSDMNMVNLGCGRENYGLVFRVNLIEGAKEGEFYGLEAHSIRGICDKVQNEKVALLKNAQTERNTAPQEENNLPQEVVEVLEKTNEFCSAINQTQEVDLEKPIGKAEILKIEESLNDRSIENGMKEISSKGKSVFDKINKEDMPKMINAVSAVIYRAHQQKARQQEDKRHTSQIFAQGELQRQAQEQNHQHQSLTLPQIEVGVRNYLCNTNQFAQDFSSVSQLIKEYEEQREKLSSAIAAWKKLSEKTDQNKEKFEALEKEILGYYKRKIKIHQDSLKNINNIQTYLEVASFAFARVHPVVAVGLNVASRIFGMRETNAQLRIRKYQAKVSDHLQYSQQTRSSLLSASSHLQSGLNHWNASQSMHLQEVMNLSALSDPQGYIDLLTKSIDDFKPTIDQTKEEIRKQNQELQQLKGQRGELESQARKLEEEANKKGKKDKKKYDSYAKNIDEINQKIIKIDNDITLLDSQVGPKGSLTTHLENQEGTLKKAQKKLENEIECYGIQEVFNKAINSLQLMPADPSQSYFNQVMKEGLSEYQKATAQKRELVETYLNEFDHIFRELAVNPLTKELLQRLPYFSDDTKKKVEQLPLYLQKSVAIARKSYEMMESFKMLRLSHNLYSEDENSGVLDYIKKIGPTGVAILFTKPGLQILGGMLVLSRLAAEAYQGFKGEPNVGLKVDRVAHCIVEFKKELDHDLHVISDGLQSQNEILYLNLKQMHADVQVMVDQVLVELKQSKQEILNTLTEDQSTRFISNVKAKETKFKEKKVLFDRKANKDTSDFLNYFDSLYAALEYQIVAEENTGVLFGRVDFERLKNDPTIWSGLIALQIGHKGKVPNYYLFKIVAEHFQDAVQAAKGIKGCLELEAKIADCTKLIANYKLAFNRFFDQFPRIAKEYKLEQDALLDSWMTNRVAIGKKVRDEHQKSHFENYNVFETEFSKYNPTPRLFLNHLFLVNNLLSTELPKPKRTLTRSFLWFFSLSLESIDCYKEAEKISELLTTHSFQALTGIPNMQSVSKLAGRKFTVWMDSKGWHLNYSSFVQDNIHEMPPKTEPLVFSAEIAVKADKVDVQTQGILKLEDIRRLNAASHLHSDELKYNFSRKHSIYSYVDHANKLKKGVNYINNYYIPSVTPGLIPQFFPRKFIDLLKSRCRGHDSPLDLMGMGCITPFYSFDQNRKTGFYELKVLFSIFNGAEFTNQAEFCVARVDPLTVHSFLSPFDERTDFQVNEFLIQFMMGYCADDLGLPGDQSINFSDNKWIAPADLPFPGVYKLWKLVPHGAIHFDHHNYSRALSSLAADFSKGVKDRKYHDLFANLFTTIEETPMPNYKDVSDLLNQSRKAYLEKMEALNAKYQMLEVYSHLISSLDDVSLKQKMEQDLGILAPSSLELVCRNEVSQVTSKVDSTKFDQFGNLLLSLPR